jgi:hypothetical protein
MLTNNFLFMNDKEIKDFTPNWPCKDDFDEHRYTSMTLSVNLCCSGIGLNRREVAKIAKRVERAALGRSHTRTVSVIL